MSNSDGYEWRLVGTTLAASATDKILPVITSNFQFVLNEGTGGAVTIPLDCSAASTITEGMLVVLYYRGAVRGSFLVENIRKVPGQEGAKEVLSVSGRGGMTVLARAIIWGDGTTSTTRTFTSVTKASILVTLVTEAQARSGLSTLTLDFDAVNDSDSVAWTDSETYKLNVGMSLLDLVRQFAKTGIDFEVNYSGTGFVLSAYKNGIGTDKSENIFFRVGTNCQEIDIDQRGNDIKNALLVAYQAGQIVVTDSASITANGRREELLDARLAQTAASATTYGAAILDTVKDTKIGRTINVYDGVPPYLFVNYILGDTVTLDIEGTETIDRILGIQCNFDNGEYSNVVIELNSLMLEQNLRMQQDIDYLLNNWQTAHDAGLLEVSYWAAIGDASTTYNVSDFCIIGDYLYMINGSTTILKYGLKNGIWYPIVLTSLPNCLAAVGTNLYIGGLLQVIKYDTLTDTQTSVTVADTGSPLSANVSAFAVNGTTLYAGGQFTSINDVAAVNIAQLNTLTSTWSSMADAVSFISGSVLLRMLYSNGLLYSSAGTQLQAWNGTTWSNVGAAFGGNILALAEYGTDLLAGGQMTNGVYIWDGATWAIFGGGVNAAVRALGVYLTDVYIGGSFTDAGNYVARYSGGTWWQLETGTNALVDAMILNGSDLYVGGDFTTVGNTDKPAQGIAAYFNNFESLSNYLENASSSFNMGAAIHAAAASAITDTDEVPFWEASVNALRKITWANILTTIRTWLLSSTATTQVLYNDAGAIGSDSELTYDKTYNVLEVGGTNWYTGATRSNSVQVTTESGGASSHVLLGHSYQTGTGDFLGVPSLGGDRATGSKASPTAILNDMGLVRFVGGGYDGTTLSGTRAQIVFKSTADWTASSHPTNIEFWTTPSGSTVRELKFVIGTSGIESNITAGKTLVLTATDNFTMTVPATGTAALLATANVFTANQTLGGAADPKLILNEGNTGTSLFEIIDLSTTIGQINKTAATGTALIDINPAPADGTSAAGFRFFRSTNTTGTVTFQVFKGDNTATIGAQVSGSSAAFTYFGTQNHVGIGTASPAGKLHVKGLTDDEQFIVDFYSTQSTVTNPIRFRTSAGSDVFTFSALGTFTAILGILSSGATAGIGYATGAGGTVTQATNKATGVTLNKATGLITMNNAALAADTTVTFTLTSSAIAATDTIILNHASAGTAGAYTLNAQVAAGSATINVRNVTAGSLSEAIVIRYTVIKSVSA